MFCLNNKMIEDIFDFSKGINLVYGEAATGKTTLAMQLSGLIAERKRVVFIDSERGFSLDRFKQINPDYKKKLEKIFLLKVESFFEQHKAVDSLDKIKELGLVVVDTLGMHYRTYVREDYGSANRMMDKQFKTLQNLTRKNIPVLVTTQVYSDVESGEKNVKLLGGEMIRNWAGVVIRLNKNPRKIIIEKPFKKDYNFQIWEKGVELE